MPGEMQLPFAPGRKRRLYSSALPWIPVRAIGDVSLSTSQFPDALFTGLSKGTVNVKMLPLPSSLVAQIRPP